MSQTGCPKPKNTGQNGDPDPGPGVSFQKETAADVEALEKLGAKLTKNKGGYVISANLDGLRIDGEKIKHLAGLPNLESLVLTGREVDAAGIESIQGLTKLKKLVLDKTSVDDEALAKTQGVEKPPGLAALANEYHQRRAGPPAEPAESRNAGPPGNQYRRQRARTPPRDEIAVRPQHAEVPVRLQ